MNRWEAIEAFVAVCEQRSFSKAAEQLGVSKSHISRQVAQLENHLDALLLNRTTRVVSPTDLGQSFFASCRSTLESLSEAEQSIVEQQHEARGLLTVSVAGQFAEDYIVPAAIKFMQKYVRLSVNLDFNNRVVDLVAEGYDLAIRAGTLKDSSLIARRIAPRQLLICASPAYFLKHGQPKDIHDLRNHNCLLGTLSTWRLKEGTRNLDLRMEGNWRSNNGRALVEAALAGLGIVQLPSFYLQQYIKQGALQTTLEESNATDTGTWAVYPSNRHMSQKVRLFINFLVEELSHL
ncbi:transcriptional regulator, LysR family [Alteromonadaceae bacterium Bs31]|nr:transcriptional regulator, LysR family [Alteromonadaceae bacterium Bs31]